MKTKKVLSYTVCVILFCFIFFINLISAAPEKDNQNIEPQHKKYIAITFDDGPHPVYTRKILDVLAEKNVVATFFVVGGRAEIYPEALIKMKELKCEIGNHTYDHVDLSKTRKAGIIYQIQKCSEAIYAATGEYPVVYRPPFGRIRKEDEKSIPMKKILWTVDSLDWNTKNKDKVVKNVVKSVKEGSIILMHDFYSSTLKALPEIIDELRAAGYEFATVSELAALKKISNLHDYFMDD